MDKFKFVMSGLWTFLAPFIRQLLSHGGTLLIHASMQAVAAVAMDMKDKSGSEKRDAAFDMIKRQLTEQGVDMAASAINAALEAAVIKLQAK